MEKNLNIWNSIKTNPDIAILCLCIGYVGGIGTYKYLSDYLDTDVVLKNSYIFKSEIDKNYVSLAQYNILRDEYRDIKSEIKNSFVSLDVHNYLLKDLKEMSHGVSKLRNDNISLTEYKSNSVATFCKQTTDEIRTMVRLQNKVETQIEQLVDTFSPLSSSPKRDTRIKSDRLKAEEKRKHSEQLNLQLTELYKLRQKCSG
jgi:hypothetical protein